MTRLMIRYRPVNSVCSTAGMVYNVSAYMDFHPGGEEELMKAAGIDGTDLFDQVNDQLAECL